MYVRLFDIVSLILSLNNVEQMAVTTKHTSPKSQVSSILANLAAFLTVQSLAPPISAITELGEQTKIAYGTVRHSGIASFFNNTNITPYAKMWAQMSEITPENMVDSTEEGLARVRNDHQEF